MNRASWWKVLPRAAILLAVASPVAADYQAGLNAYAVGKYDRAMVEWREVTDGSPTAVNPLIFAESHYAIARLYWQGEGVPRDFDKAREWLEAAAGLGHAGAMGKLGFLYTDGISVQQDFAKAFEWYSKAARNGDVDGLYNLGIFYLNGWGVERDVTRAKSYLGAASAQGDIAAEEALQRLLAEEAADATVGPEGPPTDSDVGAASAATGADVTVGPEGPPAASDVGAASAATMADVTVRPEGPPAASDVGAASAATGEAGDSPPQSTIQDENWILAQDPEHYTIQVIGLREREVLVELIEGLEDLRPWAIYVVQRDTNPLFVMVQGVYPDVEDARSARDTFPRKVNRPDRVWIRQFGKIQSIIRQDQDAANPTVGAASAATGEAQPPPSGLEALPPTKERP